MPRSHPSCKTGGWPGQHHCRDPRRSVARVIRALLALSLAYPAPSFAQNLLHIRVVEGEGAILSAGGKSTRGVVVEITDETGRPVDGAAVSFRMPEEGPGATFDRDMRTEIRTTTPDGRASVHNFVAGRLTGPYQVRITVVKNGVRAGTLVSQYVSDAAIAKKVRGGGSGRKWIAILAVAGGAAAGGLVAINGRGSGASAAAPVATPPQIGTPTFTVGRPQ